MKALNLNTFILILILILCFVSTKTSLASEELPNQADNINKIFSVHFKPNEMIQIIAPLTSYSKNTDQAAKLRNEYYRQALPLASKFGFKRHGQLDVAQTIVGDFKPSAYVIASWPSVSSFEKFAVLPEWPKYKAMRVEAWDELKLFNAKIEQAVTLSFNEGKFYTLVFAWTNPKNPSDYVAYLAGIEAALERVGGKFMLQLKQPELESHDESEDAPDYITLAEWDSKDGFEKLSKQNDYQRYIHLRDSGLAKIEFHRVVPKT